MDQFKKINNITGWVVFLISLIVYTMTLEATVSFWDCGEFILAAYKMQVVHPPGAPVFLVIGRLFTLLAGGNEELVPWMVNFMSGLSSAFGVLFIFWIVTHMARRMVIPEEKGFTPGNIAGVMVAGIIGALACTFSDTYWFSAVEGEVYALSTMLLFMVFWAMMKWEEAADTKDGDRWLIFIALLLGLSTGVHLMSLLAVPAMAMVYYFKKYKPNFIGASIAVTAGVVLLGSIYVGIVSKLTGLLASIELLAVNSFGLPFSTGFLIGGIILPILIVAGIAYSYKKNLPLLNTGILSLMMILMGFSFYFVVIIRSNANTPINMNRPDNVYSLLSYLNREQYGSRPLLRGPMFDAYPIATKEEGKRYAKGEDKYEVVGEKIGYEFKPSEMVSFPRMGSWQDPRHVKAYRAMLGLKKEEKPKYSDNIDFFLDYQIGFMWFRYFMWNFSGRQNDIQGFKHTNDTFGGRWITGINFIDEMLIGPTDNIPDRAKNNKARNTLFMLPFLLGLFGMFYHFGILHSLGILKGEHEQKTDAWVILTLFMFTGIFEIIYFNSPPFEPRERDYTLVGSFVTYTIWIGLGALAIFDILRRRITANQAAIAALVVGGIVPGLMCAQEWDDHDRSARYTARDFAINYLESCAPNAIIFTQGDNDTYPLWYAQEVENIRPDIRIVNLSLLGVQWYIDQLRYKFNDAAPVKLTLPPESYKANKRDVVRYYDHPELPNTRIELKDVINFIAREDRKAKIPLQGGDFINFLPTKKFKITVDKDFVNSTNMVPDGVKGKVLDAMEWNVNKNNLLKNDLLTLDIVASNIWERPIYFAVSVAPSSYLGLGKFFQLEGLSYRIVPVANKTKDAQSARVAADIMYENMMTEFRWGNMQDVDVHLDENIHRMTMNLRSNFARLGQALIAKGETQKAVEVLDKCIEVMPAENIPYNLFMLRIPEVYYQAGENEKARVVIRELVDQYHQDFIYFSEMGSGFERKVQQAMGVVYQMNETSKKYNDAEMQAELTEKLGGMGIFQ